MPIAKILSKPKLLTENNVSNRLFGKPSGCVEASIKNSYGRGCSGSKLAESRIVIPSKNELDTASGSVPVIPRALASTCDSAPWAAFSATSGSPPWVRSCRVSIRASITSKSSREIELSAVTGYDIETSINKIRNIADFLGSPDWGKPGLTNRSAPPSIPNGHIQTTINYRLKVRTISQTSFALCEA